MSGSEGRPNLNVLFAIFIAWVVIMFVVFGLGVELAMISAFPAMVLLDAVIRSGKC